MVRRVIYGEVANPQVAALKDICSRETLILSLAAVLVLALGIWPEPLLDVMRVSLQALLTHVHLAII